MAGEAELREREARLNDSRRARIELNVRRLVEGGLLDEGEVAPRFERLYEQFRIIMTSWLRAGEIMAPDRSDEASMCHYTRLAFSLFEPYCTPRGQAQMRALLDGAYDAGGADGDPTTGGDDETRPDDPDTDGDGVQDGTELSVTDGEVDPDDDGPIESTDPDHLIPDAPHREPEARRRLHDVG